MWKFLKKIGTSLLGLAPAGISAAGGRAANIARAKEGLLNRQFQERMSSTAFQRQTKDLEAAGLNRILGMSGSGAATPGGSMAQQQDIMTPAISTALAARRLAAEIKQINARTKLIGDQSDVIKPAAEAGEQIGDWMHSLKNADWGAMGTQLLQDLQLTGIPHSARQLTPLQIDVTKGKREQTDAELTWLQRYYKNRKPIKRK